MANTLPITIQMGALPATVQWTPQQLADAMVSRMSLQTAQTFALFVTGSTAPTSNVGPWLKESAGGSEWWVWSDPDGAYVPITINSASLGYWIGSDAPDPTIYSFWIETAVGGSPLALKIYYSGAWVDVYATTLALKAPLASPALTGTPTSPTAAPGTNNTQIATTAFVGAAISAIPPSTFSAYPAQATSAGAQTIAIDAAAHKCTLDTADFNPAPAPFNLALSRYIAPAAGVYLFSCTTQFDNSTGTAAGMRVNIEARVNGLSVGYGTESNVPSPNGSRWFPAFSVLLNLAQNDFVELWATIQDGVNTGNITLTTLDVGLHRVSA